ncbi:MAG: hypothetical protein H0V82_00070 [Candidatus Protochlamydia sp.]|nr:hypothetical protein [Candidatus Protochlamydia sp.]
MKNLVFNFLFIGLLLPLFAFSEFKIVFIGDSITQGGFEYSDRNYVALTQEQLKEDGYDVKIVNYACAGTPTETSLQHMVDNLPLDIPDIVVISSGIVDALYRTSPLKVKSNLSKMIELCFEHDAKVILGLINISCWPRIESSYVTQFNKIYRDLSKVYSIRTFPFLNDLTLGNKEYNFGDLIHPSQKGDQKIFQWLYPEIIHLLQKREKDDD